MKRTLCDAKSIIAVLFGISVYLLLSTSKSLPLQILEGIVGLTILFRLTVFTEFFSGSRDRFVFALILTAGFLARFIYPLAYQPVFTIDADARVYWYHISEPLSVLMGSPERPPGYPLFGKLVLFWQKEPQKMTLCMAQVLLNSYGIFQIYRLGVLLFSRATGLISAALFASWLPLIDVSTKIFSEPIAIFLLLYLSIEVAKLIQRQNEWTNSQFYKQAAWIGLIYGISIVVRPSSVFLFPALLVAVCLSKLGLRKTVSYAMIMILGALVPPNLISIKNYILFGIYQDAINSHEFMLTVVTRDYVPLNRYAVLNAAQKEKAPIPEFETNFDEGPLLAENLSRGVYYNKVPFEDVRIRIRDRCIEWGLLPKGFQSTNAAEINKAMILPPEWREKLDNRLKFNLQIARWLHKNVDPQSHEEHLHFIMAWHLLNQVQMSLFTPALLHEKGLVVYTKETFLRAWDYWKIPPYIRSYCHDQPEWSLFPSTVVATDLQHWFVGLLFPLSLIALLMGLFKRKFSRSLMFCWSVILFGTLFFAMITYPENRYVLLIWVIAILLCARVVETGVHRISEWLRPLSSNFDE